MCMVQFLEPFLARRVQIVAADCHDVVAAVCRWVVDWLVLAHEGEGDGGCEAAEGKGGGADVEEVPGARVGETGLEMIRTADA